MNCWLRLHQSCAGPERRTWSKPDLPRTSAASKPERHCPRQRKRRFSPNNVPSFRKSSGVLRAMPGSTWCTWATGRRERFFSPCQRNLNRRSVMRDSLINYRIFLLLTVVLFIAGVSPVGAAPMKKLDRPPLSDSWFGVYVDGERVGFSRQTISENADGYRIDVNSSARFKVMGMPRDAISREIYLVSKNLSLRSFDVEKNVSGSLSHVTGKVNDTIMRVKIEVNGSTTDKPIKFKGDVYPGPALNLYPMMRPIAVNKSYKILTFDQEEIKVKEVTI